MEIQIGKRYFDFFFSNSGLQYNCLDRLRNFERQYFCTSHQYYCIFYSSNNALDEVEVYGEVMSMIYLNSILEKEIFYSQFSTERNWIKDFPKEKWAIIIVADEKNSNYFSEIINKCINRNVAFITSVGKQYDSIHDLADEEIVFREVDIEKLYLPKHSIITIGEKDFENGIWEGIYMSLNEEVEIKKIVILDIERKFFEEIKKLIEKFKNGYLPESD